MSNKRSLSDEQMAALEAAGKVKTYNLGEASNEPSQPKAGARSKRTLTDEEMATLELSGNVKTIDADTGKPSSTAQTILEQFGQTATLGYLPQAQAIFERLMPDASKGADKKLREQGFSLPPEQSYVQSRDENIARLQKQEVENPYASLTGKALGMGASLLVPSGALAKGATAAGRIAGASKAGAVIGALQNPGDVEGETGLQLEERAKGSAIGLGLGAATQGAGELISKVAPGITAFLKNKAERQAVSAIGANKKYKDILREKGIENELGARLLDEDVVSWVTTPGLAKKRLESKISEANTNLSALIDGASEKLSDRKFFDSLSKEDQASLLWATFNPKEVAEEIKGTIAAKYTQIPKEKIASALDEVDSWFKGKADQLGIKDVQEMKVQMNRFLKDADFWKQPQNFAKEGTLAVRKAIKEGVEKQADAVASVLGEQGGKIKDTNRRLGQLIEAQDIAENRISMNEANRTFGLTDTIAAGAGIAGGGTGIEKAILGLGLGAVNKLGRTIGAGIQAKSLETLSKAIAKTPVVTELISKDPVSAQLLINQVFQGIVSPSSKEGEKAINDETVRYFLKNNPEVVESISNPVDRKYIKTKIESEPKKAGK